VYCDKTAEARIARFHWQVAQCQKSLKGKSDDEIRTKCGHVKLYIVYGVVFDFDRRPISEMARYGAWVTYASYRLEHNKLIILSDTERSKLLCLKNDTR